MHHHEVWSAEVDRARCYPSSMSSGSDELASAVAAALGPLTAVRVAYLFGSRAAGTARPDSDLDVAVAYERGASEATREATRRAVVGALTDALGRIGERTDVVDLDYADSAVAFHAVRDGRLLLARTESERVRIVSGVCSRYDDDAPKRALFRDAARAAVARLAGE